MKEQLVSFEVAKLAKEKGFSENCFHHYNSDGCVCENHVEMNKMYIATHNLLANNTDFELERWGGGNKYSIVAPTQSLLQKWLREKHNIVINISAIPNFIDLNNKKVSFYYNIIKNNDWIEENFDEKTSIEETYYDTYEEALEVGLLEALKLIN
jgi:hypothetical protein